MAATYGYGGEFSSDEDIDRMEQQTERLVQSKFDNFAQLKPTKQQIEDAITTIQQMPVDQDVVLTDELLAGLLDHYKTQRGPIVDSTRKLYKKIILRLVRGDPPLGDKGDKPTKDTNGNINNNNNNIVGKQAQTFEASSDEDEPMPPVSSQNIVDQTIKNKLNIRAHNDKLEPMEVDSEIPLGIRDNKAVDLSSESDSATEESTDESSDSEVLDITPVKQPAQVAKQLPVKESGKSSGKTLSFTSDPARKTASASDTKTSADSKKKPFTRSQRVAANRSTSTPLRKLDAGDQLDQSTLTKPLSEKTQISKFKARNIVTAFLVVALAFFVYYFRSDLTKTTERLLSRKIQF